jgi:hypothetical protein
MEKVKATVVTKRVEKGTYYYQKKYFLGLLFHDIYNKNGENTKEMRVCHLAYQDIQIGEVVLCPMKIEKQGLTFDFKKPLEKELK